MELHKIVFLLVMVTIGYIVLQSFDKAMGTDLKDKSFIVRSLHKVMYVAMGIGIVELTTRLAAN